jgi:hypothetical protein
MPSAEAPMSALRADGLMSARILPLTWGLLIVSAAVVVIIAALVLIGVLRRGRTGAVAEAPLVGGEAHGWISIGVVFSTAVLAGFVVWMSFTIAGIANPPSAPALSIEVIGHQWWWEFVYFNDDPSEIFTTANEVHIPVGKPVRFALDGGVHASRPLAWCRVFYAELEFAAWDPEDKRLSSGYARSLSTQTRSRPLRHCSNCWGLGGCRNARSRAWCRSLRPVPTQTARR